MGNGTTFVEVSGNKMSASVRSFLPGESSYAVEVTIKGKYNGYHATLVKEFELTPKTGDFGRLTVTVYNALRQPLNFTLHTTSIENRPVDSPGTEEFAAHITPGQHRFMIDCFSEPESNLGFDKIYFDAYITTLGAHLTVYVEEYGIHLIDFHNNTPGQPNIYRYLYPGAY